MIYLPILSKYRLIIYFNQQFKVELEGFPAFRGEYFRNGFGGCVTVSADVGSIEPVRQLLHFDDVYAAFGIHPHVVRACRVCVSCVRVTCVRVRWWLTHV